MSSFASNDLFADGPHRFHVGGLTLRHVVHEAPGSTGVQLASQGVHGRSIRQSGDLICDDPATLRSRLDDIEALLDGNTHDLVDDLGRTWPGVVMLSVEAEPVRRLGARWAMAYRINYLQTRP